jgi:VanZ family protein
MTTPLFGGVVLFIACSMKHLAFFLKQNIWAILWGLIILVLCAIPGRDLPHVSLLEIISFDKWVHAGMFYVLTSLMILGFTKATAPSLIRPRPVLYAFILCTVYGGLLEVMQGTLFEDRSADVYDFIANTFGATLATLTFRSLRRRLQRFYS